MILFFGSEFCKSCEALKKSLNAKKIKYQYVDVEKNDILVRKYDIQSIPTILFLKNDIVIDSYIGNGKNLWEKIKQYED